MAALPAAGASWAELDRADLVAADPPDFVAEPRGFRLGDGGPAWARRGRGRWALRGAAVGTGGPAWEMALGGGSDGRERDEDQVG